MYKSPIDIIASQLQAQMEDDLVSCVRRYGFNVDKEELTRALQYDRGQYDAGFKDGYDTCMSKVMQVINKHLIKEIEV